MNNKPQTDFVLIRYPRDADGKTVVSIIHGIDVDTDNYRFLRMSPATDTQIEEWVHTSEYDAYLNTTSPKGKHK